MVVSERCFFFFLETLCVCKEATVYITHQETRFWASWSICFGSSRLLPSFVPSLHQSNWIGRMETSGERQGIRGLLMKPITCRRIVGGRETKGKKTKMEKVFERAGRRVCGCISRMKGSRLLMPHWIVFSPLFFLYRIHYAFALFHFITNHLRGRLLCVGPMGVFPVFKETKNAGRPHYWDSYYTEWWWFMYSEISENVRAFAAGMRWAAWSCRRKRGLFTCPYHIDMKTGLFRLTDKKQTKHGLFCYVSTHSHSQICSYIVPVGCPPSSVALITQKKERN